MEEAKQARTLAKGQFTRSEKALEKVLNNYKESPISTIERKLNDFNVKWAIVQETHDKLTLFGGDMTPDESGNLDPWLSELIDRFDTLEMEADKIIEAKKEASRSVSVPKPERVRTNEGQSNMVKIERLRFASFDGDIRRYPQFKKEFQLHIRPQCSDSQLGFVLKGYLSTAVKEEVESCGDNYLKIWERLDQRYGDVGQLIRRILNEIQVLPMSKFDSRSTLHMINVVDKAHRDLINLDAEDEMCNATIIALIEKRMPSMMYQEWLKNISGKSHVSKAKFKLLMELLHDWRNRLQYDCGGNDVPEVKAKVYHTRESDNLSKENPVRHSCWMHNREGSSGVMHPIWNCKEFLSRTAEEKTKLIKEYKACMMCLLTTCNGVEDPSRCNRSGFRCRQPGCNESHNRLLHPTVPANKIEGTSSHASEGEGTILQIQNL